MIMHKMITSSKRNKSNKTYESAWHPVEKIIGFYSGEEKTKYYRVQWTASWIPEENLVGCENLMEQYFVEQNIINKDNKDTNANLFHDNKMKLEEEKDYGCWGYKPIDVKVHDDVHGSEDETLVLKKSRTNNGTEEDNLMKQKDVNDVVLETVVEFRKKPNQSTSAKTSNKSATRAMMTTTTPTTGKSPIKLRMNVENPIKMELGNPSGQNPKSYYKELRSSLRNTRSRKTTVRKNTNSRKIYNTRSQSTRRTRNGFSYVSQCVNKLPYGCNNSVKKSSPPQQRYGKVRKILTANDYNPGDPIEDKNRVSPEERKSTDLIPLQRNTTVHCSQRIIDTKKEYDEQNNIVPEQVDMIKQEPTSSGCVNLFFPLPETSIKKEPDECSDIDDDTMSKMKEELKRYKNYNSFLKKKKCVKEEPHLDDTSGSLNDCSSSIDDQSKSRTNICNSSSDENEVDTVSTFECDVCEKMFQTSVLLHRHRFIHCENRPFTFHKRKPGCRLRNENKENLQNLSERSSSSQGDCVIVHTHQLRPRRDVKGIR